MNRHNFTGLAAGGLGLVFVVGSVALGSAPLGFAAGALWSVALVALALGVRRTADASRKARELSGRVAVLEDELRRERQGRMDAEERLASRMQLTAMRDATGGEQLVDPTSGLYSEGYFTVALDARIASARRNLNPLAIVLLEAVHGLRDGTPSPMDSRIAAAGIQVTVREADTACRLTDGSYALILDDTDENGAIWTVERIRRTLGEADPDLTMWAGIACYPAHGLTTADILDRADLALDTAREWRQDRIEVASTDS